MNKHIFLDNLTANIGKLAAGKKNYFSQSIDSPGFEKLVRSIEVSVPAIIGEGVYKVETDCKTDLKEPAVFVAKWMDEKHPTLIYHHGNNERPFDFGKMSKNTFARIFMAQKDLFPLNLIVVRAPFHHCTLSEYKEKMIALENFTLMLSVSVLINEAIIVLLKKRSNALIVTSGISLGGWITNLHKGLFGTSEVYIPLMAGTLLGELFLQSKYSRMVSDLALNHPEKIRKILNFDEIFQNYKLPEVYPLLAVYDQFIQFGIQKISYVGYPLKTLSAGHVTGAMKIEQIRNHILNVLENLQNTTVPEIVQDR
ncbi:MAG: hypothetical protein ACOC2E_07765 [Bacteroidota bacterium]